VVEGRSNWGPHIQTIPFYFPDSRENWIAQPRKYSPATETLFLPFRKEWAYPPQKYGPMIKTLFLHFALHFVSIESASCTRQKPSNLNMPPPFMTNDNETVQASASPSKDCTHPREKH